MQTMEAIIRPLTSSGGVEVLGIFAVVVGKNPGALGRSQCQ